MAKLPKFRLDDPCVGCPLLDAGCQQVATTTRRDARILVVTSGPSSEVDAYAGNHMPQDALQVFATAFEEAGFTPADFAFHSAVRGWYERDTKPTAERTHIGSQCREYLLRTIEEMKPEVIMPLGVEAAKAVYGVSRKITKIRGISEWDEEYGAYIFPMIDPRMVTMYPQNWGTFRADAASLRRLYDHDFDQSLATDDTLGNYRQIHDLQFLIDQRPSVISLDIEAMGLRWADKSAKLLTIQLCTQAGEAYLISWDHPDDPADGVLKRKYRRQLRELLCHPDVTVIGQNLKFDTLWLYTRTGVRIRIGDDCLMLSATHDENDLNKDLSSQTKRYIPRLAGYDDLFNATYDKAHMERVPLTEIVKYGCGDVDASLELRSILLPMIERDPALYNGYRRVSIPGLNAFVDMELRGQLVNPEGLEELRVALQERVSLLARSLIRQIPRSIRREHLDKGVKLSRDALVRDVLFDHPDGFQLTPRLFTKSTQKLEADLRVPSVSAKDHLPYFFDECPWAEEYAEWKKLERLLNTNVVKFRENYMIGDYVYPSYSLSKVVTGRSSSQDPNGQNYPKRGQFAKRYRAVFVPPPGFIMLEADLSQAELRISADMANERTMIEIYNTPGGDIHKATALIVAGLTMEQFLALPKDEQSLLRFKAKAVNFGFIYGMGWRKFMVYAKTQYGVEFTPQEAQRIREEFFRRYPGLVAWHRGVREFVRETGYVRSYSGRIRHLPTIYSREEYIRNEAERQAINSPVQEFGSTLGVRAMAEINNDIDPRYLAINSFVHDALYAICPPQYAEWGAKKMKQYMEGVDIEGLFGHRMRVPIVADVSVGLNGGSQYEMDDLRIDEPYDWQNSLKYEGEFPFDLPEQLVPPDDGLRYLPQYLRLAA